MVIPSQRAGTPVAGVELVRRTSRSPDPRGSDRNVPVMDAHFGVVSREPYVPPPSLGIPSDPQVLTRSQVLTGSQKGDDRVTRSSGS